MRVRCVPTRHPQDGRLELPEARLLDRPGELGAKARAKGCLVRDYAAPGLADRGRDRIDVEWHHRAHVDDLCIEPYAFGGGQTDVNHGPISHDRDLRARADDIGLADRHRVITVGNLASRMLAQGSGGLVRIAVERPVVDALRLQEHHRVVVLDRCDQETLGVIWVRGHHDLDAAHVREDSLRTLRMRLAASDTAAAGRADRHRRPELARAAVSEPREVAEDLVAGGIDVVSELYLGDRTQAVHSHAGGGGDDRALGDRSVEHAGLAGLTLQAVGDAKYTTEVADVLPEHDDVRVAPIGRA